MIYLMPTNLAFERAPGLSAARRGRSTWALERRVIE
jgi:hypothetical protein